jgi:hypothetical protein
MSDDLRSQRLHGTVSGNATEDDGEAPVCPSHGSDFAMRNDKIDENSSGTERSEELGDANERIMEARQAHEEFLQQKRAIEQRHRNIQKREWKRRVIVEERDSNLDCEEFDSDLSLDMKTWKTPYHKLPMHIYLSHRRASIAPRLFVLLMTKMPSVVTLDSSEEEEEDDDY